MVFSAVSKFVLIKFQISNLPEPRGLAVEWVTKRLYLIDVRKGTIVSTNFNGSDFVTITTTGPRPLDIVVDPKSKVVIWYVELCCTFN